MDTQTLVILALAASFVILVVLVACCGYRTSNVMFLGVGVLPVVWLSRLHEYLITIGESTFVLLWGVFAIIVLLGWITGSRETHQLLRQSSRGVVLSLSVLVGLMVLSSALNSHNGNDIIRGINAVIFVVLPFLAAAAAARWCRIDEAGIQRAVLALLLAGNVLAVMSIVTAIAPGAVKGLGVGVSYRAYGYSRGYSPLGGANGTGMALVMTYCLAFGQLLAGKQRLLSATTVVLSFVALLTTLARGALVGFVVANAFLVFWQWRGLARRLMVASVLGVFLLIPLAYKLNQHYTLERLNPGSVQTLGVASTAGRLETMKASMHYGLHHLALGGGWGLVYDKPRIRYAYSPGSADRTFLLGDYMSLTTPHSLPALVFVESGALALLVLGWFAWSMWRALRVRNPELIPHGAALVHGFRAGILGFMVVSLVQDNLFLSDRLAFCYYLYFFTGLAAATCYETVPRYSPQPEPSQPITTPSRLGGRWRDPLPEI